MSYKDKNILILGCSSGIGKATVELFGREQANLYLVARREERLQQLADVFSNIKKIYPIDLSKEGSVEYVYTDLKSQEIKLDGMVYCAGMSDNVPMRLFERDHFKEILNINVFPFLEAARFFLSKKYSVDGGTMVVISSASTKRPEMGRGEYTASKGTIDAIVPILAKEGLKRRIRVNSVSPAFVNTELYQKSRDSFDVDGLMNSTQPLGLIEPEYVAEAVEFLISEKAKYITGQTIYLDAGSFL